MKCAICENEIEESFLEKMKGTIVKIKNGDKNIEYHVCDKCQKKYKDKLRDKLKEISE